MSDYSDNSNYPLQYEKTVTTRTGLEIFIRPVKPGDKHLLLDLFDTLSPRTIYYRFFSPLNRLTDSMLEKFTRIDYKSHMALLAMDRNDSKGKLLGIARFISVPNQPDAEFAVIVCDELQGKGVGRALLENLIIIAKENKIESMSGCVLAENIQMLSLGSKLGFSLSRVPGECHSILKIDLKSVHFSREERKENTSV